ncbi:MAG TPA: DNA-binding protein, partial [Hyphomicrobiales bacterium]|nr:DNA-binding protein [Hyphomicrobiales bacterium]
MAVGVPENDVFAAADAVLARGERPTVERVRLELGRGSPARVGTLLDQWWEQLAARLRGEARLPGLPAEVAQAFRAIWQQATILAQGVAEQALSAQRQVLNEEREALGALEARARLDVAQARQQASEAVTTRQGAETRLAGLEQLLAERQAQIYDLRAQRD